MSNPVKFPAFDLSTPEGRRAAEHDLVWTDHGFLRNLYQNFHWIEPGQMARSNQPSPAHIAKYAALGFKTILNARGKSDTGYYALEKEACEKHGITLIDLRLRSREPPSVEAIHRCKQIFETIAYPALLHCKSGADRAGVAAVLYKHFKMGCRSCGGGGAALAEIPAREAGQDRDDRLFFDDVSRRDERERQTVH